MESIEWTHKSVDSFHLKFSSKKKKAKLKGEGTSCVKLVCLDLQGRFLHLSRCNLYILQVVLLWNCFGLHRNAQAPDRGR